MADISIPLTNAANLTSRIVAFLDASRIRLRAREAISSRTPSELFDCDARRLADIGLERPRRYDWIAALMRAGGGR